MSPRVDPVDSCVVISCLAAWKKKLTLIKGCRGSCIWRETSYGVGEANNKQGEKEGRFQGGGMKRARMIYVVVRREDQR